MARRNIGGGKKSGARRLKPAKRKRARRPSAVDRRRLSADDLRQQLHQQTVELAEARRQLHETLEQQAATADVLKVIGRSAFDLQAVLHTLVESAARLCDADHGTITRQKDGAFFRAATFGFTPEFTECVKDLPVKIDRSSATGRALVEGEIIHIDDVRMDQDYTFAEALNMSEIRTAIGVPMMHEGIAIGVLALIRSEVRPFTNKQIELVSTFADQAAIAIENAQLFDEVQAKTRDLTESLQQQTATAEVLKVISRSTFDLQVVLETLANSAGELCRAENVQIFLRDGDLYRLAAHNGFSLEYQEYVRQHPIAPGRHTLVARTALMGAPVHIPDALADPEYTFREGLRLGGYRAMFGVPLLREGSCIGVMAMTRKDPEPFSEKQIELVSTFADQAVIAIENVRLFDAIQSQQREVAEALEHQVATSEVLAVISRSPTSSEPVFQAIVESAAQLCDAIFTVIWRYDGQSMHYAASHNFTPEVHAKLLQTFPKPPDRSLAAGRAILDGEIAEVRDMLADPTYAHEFAIAGRWRSSIAIPMLRNGRAIGAISLGKADTEPFSERQIKLMTTFADQAVIAIENVRLFESVEARTRELARSLEDLRAAQDRLIQTEKLASLGQLTAGIAHEIKNPLNFVNNFSAISADLIDELRQALAGIRLDSGQRGQIDEIADMLRGNLDKVVQHGKRADSIIKNMLLHSRQGSGERRPIDINTLVEESLNLAYHGARAEKQDFNITLDRSFDPAAGQVELFPQEMTRVLLNLISNGFYATTKRKSEHPDGGYEPLLSAATKNLGDHIEIRIRDNGTGIAPDVRDKIFNPFFTTKPTGEGTGLGLSLSHDIVVKQHAGMIEVDTKPGEFTEFRIVLPRAAATTSRPGGGS
jgi:signal transduction histidine kinase